MRPPSAPTEPTSRTSPDSVKSTTYPTCTQTNQENIMRPHRNQLCPIHRSRFCCGREAIPREKRQRQMGVRRIEDSHHPRGTGNSAPTVKCGNSSTGRSSLSAVNAHSARRSSPTTPMSCRTISIHAAWEEHGETIIRKTSRRSIGGATGKRDRAEDDFWPEYCLSHFTIE